MSLRTVEQRLLDLGFTSNEVKVYLALVDNKTLKAGRIAELAKLNRSSCYMTLQRLMAKGFASCAVINKVKWFQAANPKRVLEDMKEQQESLRLIMPELQARYRTFPEEGNIKLFKGKKGIQTMLLDVLDNAKILRAMGSERELIDSFPYFLPRYIQEKVKRGIKTKLLVPRWKKAGQMKGKYTSVRFLPKHINAPVSFSVYADRVLIMMLTTEPEGVMIQNQDAAKSYIQLFDFMWAHAEK